MKHKLLTLGVVFLILFTLYLIYHIVYYKTTGNNNQVHWTNTTHIETCDMNIFSTPKNCKKTTLPTWCEGHGGTWDATIRTCNDISFFACHEARNVVYDSPNCFVPRIYCSAQEYFDESGSLPPNTSLSILNSSTYTISCPTDKPDVPQIWTKMQTSM